MIKRWASRAGVSSFLNTACIVSVVVLSLLSSSISAEVDQVCIDRFQANGAIPGDPSCAVLALTSRAGLSDFACTGPAGEAIITEYCGLVDDDSCDFRPLETIDGSITLTTDATSTVVSGNVERLFNAQYGVEFALAGTNLLAVFPFVFGLADLAFSPTDFGSQFDGLGDFGGLINNLEDCP